MEDPRQGQQSIAYGHTYPTRPGTGVKDKFAPLSYV
jgi:hypothetical protein